MSACIVMNEGESLWYRQGCRGGYGFDHDVPGWYVKTTLRRVIIRVTSKDGSLSAKIAVAPNNIRSRHNEEYCDAYQGAS